jgi:hypothetical protein
MRLVGYGFAGVEPETMGVGPIPSTERALRQTGLSIEDIGLFELNEAFAVQVLAFLDHFGVDDEDPRVNPYGGAIALGHPLASSGVRLMTQLARQFAERPDVRYGLAAMCVGFGMGGTVIWENTAWRASERAAVRGGRHLRRRPLRRGPRPGRRDRADHPRQRLRPHQADDLRAAGPGEHRRRPHRGRGARAAVRAVAVTGKPFIFAVGADLKGVGAVQTREEALEIGRLGHRVFKRLKDSASRRSRSSTARPWAAASRSRCTATTAPSRPACPPSRCRSASWAWCPAGAARSCCRT